MKDHRGKQEIPPKNTFYCSTAGKDNLYLQNVCRHLNFLITTSSGNRGRTAGERTTVLRYFFLALQSKTFMHFSFFNVYSVSISQKAIKPNIWRKTHKGQQSFDQQLLNQEVCAHFPAFWGLVMVMKWGEAGKSPHPQRDTGKQSDIMSPSM